MEKGPFFQFPSCPLTPHPTDSVFDSVSVGWGINGGELSIIFIRKVSPTIFNIVLKRVFWGPTTLSVLHMLKTGLGFLEIY